ncbi:polyprenyl synthetase family protein [Ornithinicoccus hortensis]|uniref:Geranylgeranyl diphosphate synthase type I n=1 Tax=Ornithinicoccus hortensis TaxID=82346 RepID=A0A542YRD1_9MICO|nr:polyprenyl synthetase family protein [Ornithinicoccus hortensis]TQL50649.1 geranylgeranyl diphosphate synthase type I [Ornithinicoccus hortensis]
MPQHPRSGVALRDRVQAALDTEIAHQRSVLSELGDPMSALVDAVDNLLAGGKRLRAAFLYWGYRAAGGADSEALVRAAASMEMFQAAALLHDDVMDDSDLRRGRPTAHRTFAATHEQAGWTGDSARFGEAGAILAGNLCLTWCDRMFAGSGLPADQLANARAEFDDMRTQLMGGQFLDVLESVRDWDDLSYPERVEQCLRVIHYKSGNYSVRQPLLIGAYAAGWDECTAAGLSDYGRELGRAFQLRDDILGVFGDPDATGKPAGDDLREGKRTVLIAHAVEHAAPDDVEMLLGALGDPDLDPARVATVRNVLLRSGAVELTEQMITDGADRATAALHGIPDLAEESRAALTDLVAACTARTT